MSSVNEKCQNGNTEMKTSSVFEAEELRVGIVAAVGVRGWERGRCMERFRVCDARPSPLNYQIDLLLAIKVWRWLQEGKREERDCSNCHLGKPRIQLHLRKKKNP